MWDYVPRDLLFFKRRGLKTSVGSHQDGLDRVDPSPRDRRSNTCIIIYLKWPRSESYSIATWCLQDRPIFIARRTLPMIVVYGIRIMTIIRSPEALSDGADKTWKNPRSRSDRVVIEPRSRRDRAATTLLSLGSRLHSIGRRSTKDQDHDRGLIAARSWQKSWRFGSKIEALAITDSSRN